MALLKELFSRFLIPLYQWSLLTINPTHSSAKDVILHAFPSFGSSLQLPLKTAINLALFSVHLLTPTLTKKKNNWDDQNSVYFEVRKTLLLPILPSMIPCLYNITSMLYRRIRYNIETFVGTTYFYYSKVFLKVRKFVQMCKGLIRQCMGFCSHIWGYSPNTHLDRIQS